MRDNYLVTGPGLRQTFGAKSYADAIARVAQLYRVNPALLCAVRLGARRLHRIDFVNNRGG